MSAIESPRSTWNKIPLSEKDRDITKGVLLKNLPVFMELIQEQDTQVAKEIANCVADIFGKTAKDLVVKEEIKLTLPKVLNNWTARQLCKVVVMWPKRNEELSTGESFVLSQRSFFVFPDMVRAAIEDLDQLSICSEVKQAVVQDLFVKEKVFKAQV